MGHDAVACSVDEEFGHLETSDVLDGRKPRGDQTLQWEDGRQVEEGNLVHGNFAKAGEGAVQHKTFDVVTPGTRGRCRDKGAADALAYQIEVTAGVCVGPRVPAPDNPTKLSWLLSGADYWLYPLGSLDRL